MHLQLWAGAKWGSEESRSTYRVMCAFIKIYGTSMWKRTHLIHTSRKICANMNKIKHEFMFSALKQKVEKLIHLKNSRRKSRIFLWKWQYNEVKATSIRLLNISLNQYFLRNSCRHTMWRATSPHKCLDKEIYHLISSIVFRAYNCPLSL